MPTYEYVCDRCQVSLELFHGMTETKKVCPECGARKLRKMISGGTGVIFKGSGFYENDYKRKPEKEKGKDGTS